MSIRKMNYAFTFINGASRLAFVPTAGSEGRVARQLDNNSYWVLTAVTPIVRWEPVTDQTGHGGWRPMAMIYDQSTPLTGTVPGQILIDDEIDLAPWGLIATTYRHINLAVMIEKPDGNGGWTTVSHRSSNIATWNDNLGGYVYPPTVPLGDDPPGYPVTFFYMAGPLKRPYHPSGSDPLLASLGAGGAGNDTRALGLTMGEDIYTWDTGSPFSYDNRDVNPFTEASADNRRTRLRVGCARLLDTYTPEQIAVFDALGYRARIAIQGMNMVAWEREVSITADGSDLLIDENINLSDFGIISATEYYAFVFEVRRNGKTIKTPDTYSRAGEQFDRPTYPVRCYVSNEFPDTKWWMYQNDGIDQTLDSGVKIKTGVGSCSEASIDNLKIVAWREGDLATSYQDGTLEAPHLDIQSSGGILSFTTGILGPDGKFRIRFADDGGQGGHPGTWIEWLTPAGDASYTYDALVHVTPDVSTVQDVWTAFDDSGPITPGTWTNMSDVMTAGYLQGQYISSDGWATVAVPGGPTNDCTLRIRLLVCPPNRIGQWPFAESDGNYTGITQLALRAVRTSSRYLPGHVGSGYENLSIWNRDNDTLMFGDYPVNRTQVFTSETRPLADASWRGRTISIKDPDADEIYHTCRQKADDSYQWFVVPPTEATADLGFGPETVTIEYPTFAGRMGLRIVGGPNAPGAPSGSSTHAAHLHVQKWDGDLVASEVHVDAYDDHAEVDLESQGGGSQVQQWAHRDYAEVNLVYLGTGQEHSVQSRADAAGILLKIERQTGGMASLNVSADSLQSSLTLSSPNGTRFRITVDDDGVITPTPVE